MLIKKCESFFYAPPSGGLGLIELNFLEHKRLFGITVAQDLLGSSDFVNRILF